MKIQFRKYIPSDFKEFHEMVQCLYREDAGCQTMFPKKIKSTIKEFFLHPEKIKIFIFQSEKIVLGYAIVVILWSNEFGGNLFLIDEIFVKPSWRNKGIGSDFFDFLLKSSIFKVKGLQIEVSKKNEKAFKLYKRIGFQKLKNLTLFKTIKSEDN